MDSLNFEKNQIRNFFKQNARLQNHNETTGKKQGKMGEFMDAAKYMLQAIGKSTFVVFSEMCVQAGTSATQPVVNLAQPTRQDLLRAQ